MKRKPRTLPLAPKREIASLAYVPRGRSIPDPSVLYGYRSQYSEIGFGRLTSILEAADRGNTVEWSELCDRMLRTDPHLFSVYESRLSPVAGARWTLEPGQGDPELAQRAADDCRAMLESLPDLERTLKTILHALGVGYSVHEIVWQEPSEIRSGVVRPKELAWVHPRRFRFDDHYRIYLYDDGLAAMRAAGDQLVTSSNGAGLRLSASKYVVHIPQAVPTYAPTSGLLQVIARYWWIKQWGLKYWLSGAALAGNPRAIGKYPQEATPEAKAELRNALEALSADGVLTLSSDNQIDFVSALTQGVTSVWDRMIQICDAGMSKALIGSTLNVEIGDTGGNRAAAESQFDTTTLPRAEADGRALWSTLERDLFTPFLTFNADRYGGVVPPIPRGRFVLYEEPTQVDDLIVSARAVTVDELRSSRGLEPFGPEKGGDRIASIDVPAMALPSASPALPSAPPKPEPASPVAAPELDGATVNGAQVTSLLEIVSQVSAGTIPRDAAIGIITVAFPSVSPERAAAMLPPEGFTPPSPDASGGAPTATPLALRERPWTTAQRVARKAASQTS